MQFPRQQRFVPVRLPTPGSQSRRRFPYRYQNVPAILEVEDQFKIGLINRVFTCGPEDHLLVGGDEGANLGRERGKKGFRRGFFALAVLLSQLD